MAVTRTRVTSVWESAIRSSVSAGRGGAFFWDGAVLQHPNAPRHALPLQQTVLSLAPLDELMELTLARMAWAFPIAPRERQRQIFP